MDYKPKLIEANDNISKKSALKELLSLLAALLLIVSVVYISLGFAVDVIVAKMPDKLENSLSKVFAKLYKEKTRTKEEGYLQAILDNLAKGLQDRDDIYTVQIVEDSHVNALAIPGNRIIIFSELLKEISSENEISFVLAHELGHFYHNDHLKAFGRSLVFFAISTVLLGEKNPASGFMQNSISNLEMKFSQSQEKNADIFALTLLNRVNGNVNGSLEFMNLLTKKTKTPKFMAFFSSHPHPQKRLDYIKETIRQRKYKNDKNEVKAYPFLER
ncbi:MAG: M48 family metallopeptidase [Candidatus Omnitrophica bacterium]|nr:M48 family metallopeptidase [Candidatus Omnitrophota bacterium]